MSGDDLENFPMLSREELEAQRRGYRALSAATPQRLTSDTEIRALRQQLETAERANGLVAHQLHLHGPCPPNFYTHVTCLRQWRRSSSNVGWSQSTSSTHATSRRPKKTRIGSQMFPLHRVYRQRRTPQRPIRRL